jgi:N-acetylglucosaminyldiphosphoundecaprenol N-acetyl-beta-D-mannosaminyltransferase
MFFCNINFNLKNKSDLFKVVDNQKTKLIITANAQFIVQANTSERFFKVLNDNYVTFDGRIPYITAKLFNLFNVNSEKVNFEKLSGSDIIYDFCAFAKENNYKIFFLGGNSESNKIAVKNVRSEYDIIISGYSPDFENYPFSDKFNSSCLEKIMDFKPEIIFVGFGAPKQEFWLDDHIEIFSKIGVKYAIGCGGTFDFLSKKIKRTPIFLQKIGLEGLYRFFQEPNKMRFKRLIVSLKFFKYIWRKPDFKS